MCTRKKNIICIFVCPRMERRVVTLESLIALLGGRGRMSGLWMTTELSMTKVKAVDSVFITC